MSNTDQNNAVQVISDKFNEIYSNSYEEFMKSLPSNSDINTIKQITQPFFNNSNNINYLVKMVEYSEKGNIPYAVNRSFAHAFVEISFIALDEYELLSPSAMIFLEKLKISFEDVVSTNLNKLSDYSNEFSNSVFNNYVKGQYDPLILDLDGDGVETVGLDKKVLFDHSNDGTKNGTGWVGKDDGLLVMDRDNSGMIENGGELFGDNTILKNGQKAKDAYEALADIDSNKDGVLDSKDADFAKLKIWQDANQDGISQASELKTLAELGIALIKTGAENSTATKLADGNTLAASSSFTRTDGTTGKTGAVNFIADETTRQFTTKIDTSKVAGLPDMQASGNVRDLREAAALSTDLATKLSNYIAAGNNRSSSDLDAIVKAWAATSSVATLASTLKPGAHPAGGRGTNLTQAEIDKFNVIEKFSGYYGGVANFIDPSDAQDGRTDGRYSGTYYGIELDAAGINRASNEYQIVNLSA